MLRELYRQGANQVGRHQSHAKLTRIVATYAKAQERQPFVSVATLDEFRRITVFELEERSSNGPVLQQYGVEQHGFTGRFSPIPWLRKIRPPAAEQTELIAKFQHPLGAGWRIFGEPDEESRNFQRSIKLETFARRRQP